MNIPKLGIGGGGDTDQIRKLRQDLLHTTNTQNVHNFLDKLVNSKNFDIYKDESINVLKYASRIHGLPPQVGPFLQAILLPRPDDSAATVSKVFQFKAALALKYAVFQNHFFISLQTLLNILLESYPAEKLGHHGNHHSNHHSDLHFTQEIITQLSVCIITILNPDRVSSEKINESRLWKLENYLAFINGNYKSEVRRCLEKMGYWSGSAPTSHRLIGNRTNQGKGALLRTGDQVVSSVQQKKGINVSAHVVKTQQTEAVTTEENISEKTQIANVSLSNALEEGRARTMAAARSREALPQTKSAEGSDRWWFKSTAWEVTNFLEKAKGDGAISPDDVVYLKNKFNGYRFSMFVSDKAMVEMIAETFYLISKYQTLDSSLMVELMNVSFTEKFDFTRKHILQAVDRHCIRNGGVPKIIHEKLNDFTSSEEGVDESDEIKKIIWEILSSDDNFVGENLTSAINMLKNEASCASGLNYIQRQLHIQSRAKEVEKQEESIIDGVMKVLSYTKNNLIIKALEVLEDYLQLGWTSGLNPDQVVVLIGLRNGIVGNAVPEIRTSAVRCVLRAMEKAVSTKETIAQFSPFQMETIFTFLFDITADSNGNNDRRLKVFTVAFLSNVLEIEGLSHFTKLVNPRHMTYFREQLIRKDVMLTTEGKLVQEEELTPKFYTDGPPPEEIEFVSTYVSKLLVILLPHNWKIVCDELTISTVSNTLVDMSQSEKAKMTRIFCAEFLFRAATLPQVDPFSPPVLNRIQSEAFSTIGDVHVYITAAYCTSLDKDKKKLDPEQVNFLVNLYSFKRICLGDEDFTPWINPKILQIFHTATKTNLDISEQVFHLLALILNNTCADSEEALDYPIVKIILEMITTFCEKHAGNLAPSVVDAVEHLLLESDVFDETCAGIVEQCMLAGRWISQPVIEEFGKYLWHEPQVSIPFLRRLGIANENQELPEGIFSAFQMELISLRLCSTGGKEGDSVLEQQDMVRTRGGGDDDIKELFLCLVEYVKKGMLMSRLSLESVVGLFQDKRKGRNKEEIVRCLAMVASNGQSLPRELIDLALALKGDETIEFTAQLEFAMAVVKRSQQLPESFLEFVFKQLGPTSGGFGWLTGSITGSHSGKVMALVRIMIQHNHHLPQEALRAYCKHIWNNKNTMVTPDYLQSLLRLVQVGGDVISGGDDETREICRDLFSHASQVENDTVAELGTKGLEALQSREETETKDSEKLDNVEEGLWRKLQQSAKYTGSEKNWQELWNSKEIEDLTRVLGCNQSFMEKIGKGLTEKNGPVTGLDEFLVEILCLTVVKGNTPENICQLARDIVEKVVSNRKYHLNSTCRQYLQSTPEMLAWGKTLFQSDSTKELLVALRRWKEKQSDKRTKTLTKLMKENKTGCLEEYEEIVGVLGFLPKKVNWRKLPHIEAVIAHAIGTGGSLEKYQKYVEVLEEMILDGLGAISQDVLQAYGKVLERMKPEKGNECVRALAAYLKTNQDVLNWQEKHLIFEIFDQLATKSSNPLPNEVADLVWEGVVNANDVILRAECYNLLWKYRQRWENEWREVYSSTLYTVIKEIYGDVDREDMEENRDNLELVEILHSLTTVDLKRLRKERQETWTLRLLVSDTIMSLVSSVNDQLGLFQAAKEFCTRFRKHSLLRLYILSGVQEYLTQNPGQLSAAALLSLILAAEKKDETKQDDFSWIHLENSEWFSRIIQKGLNNLLWEKFGADGIVQPCQVNAIVEDICQPQSPIPLQIFFTLAHHIEGHPNLQEFKQLIQLVQKRHKDLPIIRQTLKEITHEDEQVSLEQLATTLQMALLTSQLPVAANHTLREKVESHVKQLLQQGYRFSQMESLFSKVEKSLRKKVSTGNDFEGLEVLENVLYQLVAYKINASRFIHILGSLLEKKTTEWVKTCSELVMEYVYSESQGVKTANTIANEYANVNNLGSEERKSLGNFSTIVEKIQKGNFDSSLGIHKNCNIHHWTKAQIGTWANAVKKSGVNLKSSEFLTECIAVISRGCVLTRNYSLTPIQILSVYCTTITSGKGRLLQVATGSGKSTIIVTLAVLRSLHGLPVDVYTSSPVLAERDAKSWAPFYKMFGFSCDHNGDKGSGYTSGEKTCYKKDIVYGDTSQFQFDALRHEYSGLGTRADRKYGYAIVDEVDSMLVDDSSKLARLSSTLPGMDLLHTLYHFIWHRLHDIQQRLYGVGGNTYYLEGKRSVDDAGNLYYSYQNKNGEEVTLRNIALHIIQHQNDEVELESAFIYKVQDIDSFVVDHLKQYTRALVGNDSFAENGGGRPVSKLDLPKSLTQFAQSQVNNWVDSAMTAVAFQENVHYVVDQDQIKPVDYHSTGIIQSSTNWNNGLHQFLQIKHSLKVTTETVTTNFLSNMAIFKMYGPDLVGFTGTLGSKFGQQVLKEVYDVETATIPELYYNRFRQLEPRVVHRSQEEWLEKVTHSAAHESCKGRAVLVICQTIKEADVIAEKLEKWKNDGKKARRNISVKMYTRNDQNQEKLVEQVAEGEVIVATNLAGRGTDINTVKVEEKGGLHIILTFLPDSLRVEQQAFGRTARQGNKGTGELIVRSQESTTSAQDLKTMRDEGEKIKLSNFQNEELLMIETKDTLFSRFCKVYSSIRAEFKDTLTNNIKGIFGSKTLSPLDQTKLHAIEQRWATFLKKIDDGVIPIEKADLEYSQFEKEIFDTYQDVDQLISGTENCFYWVQFGNYHYKCKEEEEAAKFYQKGIDMEPEFAAGAHAGLGFALLRGKSKWLRSSAHEKNYKNVAVESLNKALRILYTEISLCTSAQTLLQQREGRTDSELFKQLTEKANLLGDYCRNIEGNVSTTERSLRRVYVHEEVSGGNRKRKLDDDKPIIEKSTVANDGIFCLEFHDLTCRYDSGNKDQAIDTIGERSNISLVIENQNLKQLVDAVEKEVKTLGKLELHGVNSCQAVQKIVDTLEAKKFVLRVSIKDKSVLRDMESSAKSKLVKITWSDDGEIGMEQGMSGEIGKVAEMLPDGIGFIVEMEFSNKDDFKWVDPFVSDEKSETSVELTDVKKSRIELNWESGEENDKKAGFLQQFNRNTITFFQQSNKTAKKLVEIFRGKNIDFVLKLEQLNFDQAAIALSNSGRQQEDIEETSLKEMGHQFSTSYIPLDVIRELAARGIFLMPVFGEKQFVPWKSVISIGILASAQVALGAFLICTGFGATVGMGLITEGMSDFVTAYRAYSSRQFSWKDYAIQKAVSLTISCVSMGLSSLKDAAKGASTVVQGVATEAVEQAGVKVITGKTLNETIKVASTNLRSLAAKYVATQGVETVARTGLNMAMDSVIQFSFDSVQSQIEVEVERTVKRKFRNPDFTQVLSICAAMDNNRQLQGKTQGWMTEVTNPQSGNWNTYWDSVGYPLINGLLSDPKYLGSKFSMMTRLIGMIHGSKEIFTVAEKVCDHVEGKLKAESDALTQAYAIQDKFGVTAATAQHIVNEMEFSRKPHNLFKVKRLPDEKKLYAVYNIEVAQLEALFKQLHEKKTKFSPDSEEASRLIKVVVAHLATHIIHVANRQLIAPVTTFAVGKLVASISEQIQSKYLVSDDQLSDDQKLARELKKKNPSELTSDEKDFLRKNDPNRPVTFAEQIRGNAKDFTVAYQKRDVIAMIQSITEEEKNNKKVPENLGKQGVAAVGNILTGGPADMTTVFLLAELNDADVKLVDDLEYEPTKEDKEKGVKIIVWQKPQDGETVGHYMVKDAGTGKVTDFGGGNGYDCAYNVLSSITGKGPDELRVQAAVFIACNEEKFGRIEEGATWIRERYPEEAAKMLHLGGRRPRPKETDIRTETEERRMINLGDDEEEESGDTNEEENEELRKYLAYRRVNLTIDTGKGSGVDTGGQRSLEVSQVNQVLKSEGDMSMVLDRDGEQIEITRENQIEMLGKQVVGGHVGNKEAGTLGTDRNLVMLTNSANVKMSKNFENRCFEFIRIGREAGLIREGDTPLTQEFYTGRIDTLHLDENNNVPFPSNLTCNAYLNIAEDLTFEQQNRLGQLFQETFEPDKRPLTPIMQNEKVIGYGATFTNTGKSEMRPPVDPYYPHNDTFTEDTSSVDHNYI